LAVALLSPVEDEPVAEEPVADHRPTTSSSSHDLPAEVEKDDYTICRELEEWWKDNGEEKSRSSSQGQWTEVLTSAVTCDHDEVMVTKYGKKFHVFKCHGMSTADPKAIHKNTQCSQCLPDRQQAEIYATTDGVYHNRGCMFGRSYGNEPRRLELCKHCLASGRV
jgi:hypothetical protein